MGRMLAHFLAAVAEFERELIRERVRSGLANAKAKGNPLGRPRADSSRVQKGLLLLDQGKTYREAFQQTGLSVSTLVRARREKKILREDGLINPATCMLICGWLHVCWGYPLLVWYARYPIGHLPLT